MTFLGYALIFCIFSIVGWILEVIYRSYMTKKFINPGFMTGCVVPLYGFGAVILTFICNIFDRINSNYKIIIIFLISIIILSILEYITGYLLLKLFNLRLWDYSMRKFNINGFICMYFSLIWGILSLLFYFYIYPSLNDFINLFLNNSFCLFALGIFYGVFFIDFAITIDLLKKINIYSKNVQQIISLEKIKIESITKLTRKKFKDRLYPYISINKFIKEKINKK